MPAFDREAFFKERFNAFFCESLSLPQRDYYDNMNGKELLQLKSVLSDINNIFTMRVTLEFVNTVSTLLEITPELTETLKNQVLSTKPSANGFDIEVADSTNIVAEVKCNVPVNGGDTYGAAQKHGIKKDLDSLLYGKKKSSIDTSTCFKFMVFLDTPEIRTATRKYLKSLESRYKELIVYPESSLEFGKKSIYIVFVNI